MQGDLLNTNLLSHLFLFLFFALLVVEACGRDGSSALTPAGRSSLAGLTALGEVPSLRDDWRVVCAASSPLGELWSWQTLIMSMQDFTLDDQHVAQPNNIYKYLIFVSLPASTEEHRASKHTLTRGCCWIPPESGSLWWTDAQGFLGGWFSQRDPPWASVSTGWWSWPGHTR